MFPYEEHYVNSEYNKVFYDENYLAKTDREIIPINKIDGTGKMNYCTSTFLYHEDTWKYDNDLIKDGIVKTAPCYVIDVDVRNEKHPDLITAQKYAIAIIERLIDNYGINPKYLYIFFSGKKGFHIEIPAEWFGGFIPAKDLHITFMKIFKALGIEQYGVDKTMYYPTQLYRCINAQNYNDKKEEVLHKIQISYDELKGDINKIVKWAKIIINFWAIGPNIILKRCITTF